MPGEHLSLDDPEFLAGRLLVAMPGIGDPRFERAVIYMCAHDDDHAMGLTLNRPVEGLTIPDLLARLEIETARDVPSDLVLMGGPVEKGRGFVLHTDDYESPGGTLPVADHVSLTPPARCWRPWPAVITARAAPCWPWATPAGARASWSVRCAKTSGWSAIPTRR